jgi:benzoyl-CoA reductase/2-hydroxyglutaryl-CoA dehydratase subunit BcrC/BadD/HgdB
MDSRWGEYPGYQPQRVEFLGAQLNKLFDRVKEILGIEVTRDAWDKAMSVSRQLYSSISQLDELMKADPMPVSGAGIGLATWLSSGSTGKAMLEGPEAIAILTQETRMMENAGLAVCTTLFSAPPPKAKFKTTYTTLGEEIAEREMRIGIYHSSYGIVKRCAQAVKDLNIDGVIWNYLFNCRPLAQTSHFLKKWVEENTGIPTLSLEIDNYDSRSYSAAALRTRVETFAEMLRAKKASVRV